MWIFQADFPFKLVMISKCDRSSHPSCRNESSGRITDDVCFFWGVKPPFGAGILIFFSCIFPFRFYPDKWVLKGSSNSNESSSSSCQIKILGPSHELYSDGSIDGEEKVSWFQSFNRTCRRCGLGEQRLTTLMCAEMGVTSLESGDDGG